MPMSATYATVNGVLVEENRGGDVTTYVSDTLGSVVKTVDETGVVTSESSYWPYGEVRTSSGNNPSPWGFVGTLGYFADASARLYVRARMYGSGVCRWLTVDPIWPSQDPYTYVAGRPLEYTDRTGLVCPQALIDDLKYSQLLICGAFANGQIEKDVLDGILKCALAHMPARCKSFKPPNLDYLPGCLKQFCNTDLANSVTCDNTKECKNALCGYTTCNTLIKGLYNPPNICPDPIKNCTVDQPIDPSCATGTPFYGIPGFGHAGLPASLGLLLHEMLHCVECSPAKGNTFCYEAFTQAMTLCMAGQIGGPRKL